MSPQPSTMVHWIDQYGRQLEPEPYEILLRRLAAGAVPASTLVWWEGADGWTPLAVVTQASATTAEPSVGQASATATETETETETETATVAEPEGSPTLVEPTVAPEHTVVIPEPGGPPTARSRLAGELAPEEVDSVLVDLVSASQHLRDDAQIKAGAVDAMVAAVITALVDAGYTLSEARTTGNLDGPEGQASHHVVRFHDPRDRSNVAVTLVPSVADGTKRHLAILRISYGENLGRFAEVAQAIWREQRSSALVSGGPELLMFDAAADTGIVSAQLELLIDLTTYVAADLAVHHDLLTRHLASVIDTLATFLHTRFEG